MIGNPELILQSNCYTMIVIVVITMIVIVVITMIVIVVITMIVIQ